MDNPSSPSPSATCPWTLWGGTTLSMSLLALAARPVAEAARAHYRAYGMTMLPAGTNAALSLAGMLWIGVMVAAAVGAWMIRANRERALSWSLFTTLFFIAAAAAIAAGLALPFQHVQTGLGK